MEKSSASFKIVVLGEGKSATQHLPKSISSSISNGNAN